jgi:ABC-type glycerol-3-phosphate transport system permease component
MTTAPAGSRRRNRLLGGAVSAVVGVVFLLPLLWAAGSSLRPDSIMFDDIGHLGWRTLLPTTATLANYGHLVQGSFGLTILNSVLVAAATVVAGLAVSVAAAFALAVIPFRGRGLVFGVVVISFLVPFDAIAIPLSALFRDWGLANTFLGLILPGIGNGLAVFLLRQFFLAVPRDLIEAGRLDGLGWWGVLLRIYLPLSGPALVGAGLTLFLFQWQAYLWPLLIGTDQEHLLGPVALAELTAPHNVDYGQIFAGGIVLTAVPLVLILRFQRRFAQSISTTGLK